MSTCKALVFHGKRRVELTDWPVSDEPLGPREVVGRTLYTLVSPGTELAWAFDTENTQPRVAGYASVVEITQCGSEVKSRSPGQLAFNMAPHRAIQRGQMHDFVPLPAGLDPQRALFCRLMGVSWTTLVTTHARPADRVIVYGLGIIGNLCAQLFSAAGYRVTALDPDARRCELARRCGIADARGSIPADDTELRNRAILAIDCSGHEQAVVDACNTVRKGGEVVLIGVPWKQRCAATAFQVTHAVFHRYVTLRSGWEWEIPMQEADFARGSILANFAAGMQWINEGRIHTGGLAETVPAQQAPQVYLDLLEQRRPTPTVILDWRDA